MAYYKQVTPNSIEAPSELRDSDNSTILGIQRESEREAERVAEYLLQISLAMATMMPRGSTWCGDCTLSSKVGRRRRDWQVRCGPSTPARVFIFGMGYTSQALAQVLQHQGWVVSGTCRSEEKRAALEARGFRAHLFDYGQQQLQEEAVQELRDSSHIVSSIPPAAGGGSDPVLESYRGELLKPQWLGYLSSTSVYGDWQGEWVHEETQPRPVEKRAVARWEAEKQWMKLAAQTGACVRVFRLGGIYGPGRSALDTVRSRERSARQRLREQKRFTSRVHVDDVCQVVAKAMTAECSPGARVYNVVDDDPKPRAEVMAYARRLLNVEDDDDVSSDKERSAVAASESFTQVSEKRVSNCRVKDELQVELLHPSFRSGLEAIAIPSDHPFD